MPWQTANHDTLLHHNIFWVWPRPQFWTMIMPHQSFIRNTILLWYSDTSNGQHICLIPVIKKKSISYPTWYSFLLEKSMPLPISMPCPCRIIWDLVIIIHSYFITKVALCLGVWRICMGFAMQYNSYLKVLIFSIHSFSNFVVKWWSLETDNLCITDLDHFGEVVGKWYKASIVDHLLWNLVILLVWWNVFISGHHESSFIKHP